MNEVRLALVAHKKQDQFIRCRDRFSAFIAGIRAGKTWAGTAKALLWAGERGGVGLVVAPTYPMLRDINVRSFLSLGQKVIAKFHRQEMRAELLNGAEVLFRSADNPETLRGLGVSWAWIDEAALCPKGTWEIVIGRLSEGAGAPCWVTTTPKGRNWVYERTAEMTVFRARTEDNPHLDPEFVAALKASYTGKFALQELEGEFVVHEGLVYEEFDRSIHVCERWQDEFKRFVIGIDEGYVNPSVMLVIGFDGDDRAHVLYEFYQRRVLQEAFVDVVANATKGYNADAVYVDPSASGLIAALRAVGVPAMPADNAVQQGIQQVKSRLCVAGDGRPRLTVSPRAVYTIAEFESYSWAEGRQGLRDVPEKVNDHAMDALRYALSTGETAGGSVITHILR